MNINDPEFHHAMLLEFECEYKASGAGRESKATTRKRENLEKSKKHFAAVCDSVHSKEDALVRVQERWTVGMGPIAAWLMWHVIGQLVKQFVFWAWEKTHAQQK